MMKWMTVVATGLMGAIAGWSVGGHLVSRGVGAFLALVLGLGGVFYGFRIGGRDA